MVDVLAQDAAAAARAVAMGAKTDAAAALPDTWSAIDLGSITTGEFYNYSNGTTAANSAYLRSSALVPVIPGETLRIWADMFGTSTATITMFSASGTYMDYLNRGGASTTTLGGLLWTVPDGVYAIGVTGYRMTPVIERKSSLALGATTSGYWSATTGTSGTSSSFVRTTAPITVRPGETLLITANTKNSVSSIITGRRQDGVFVGGYLVGNSDNVTIDKYVDYPWVVPAGVTKLDFTGYKTLPIVRRPKLPGSFTGGVDFGIPIAALQTVQSRLQNTGDYWASRAILWTGTSIPAGIPAGGSSYPVQVAAALGATVNNRSIGNSMLRVGKNTIANGAVVIGSISGTTLTVTKVLYGAVAVNQAVSAAIIAGGATTVQAFGTGSGGVGTYTLSGSGSASNATIFLGPDPLGWTGVDYEKLQRSVAMTLGEKLEYYNNWAKWKTLVGQGSIVPTPPNTLTPTDLANLQSWSYENLILPNLAAGTAWILDYGFNDSSVGGNGSELATTAPMSRDRGTMIGAANWLIDQVQAYADAQGWGPIRTIISGHYDNKYRPYISQAQSVIADTWSYPLLKLWERTGWSQQTLTTTGYWTDVPGVWVPSGGPIQTLTYLDRWVPDHVHPHQDNSGTATTLLARLLAAMLRDIR